ADALATSKMFTIVVAFPKITLAVPATSQPAQQSPMGFNLQTPFPNALSGVVTLTFNPISGISNDDPMTLFSNGTRSAPFTIPANSTSAVFSPPVLLLTGTVAGTVRITASFVDGPQDLLVGTTDIPAAAPQISSVEFTQSSAGLMVKVTGFSV